MRGNSEKLLKYDVKRREYDIVVIGEEEHLAYNRVGLTSFFQHRNVEDLFLNPREWVRDNPNTPLAYFIFCVVVGNFLLTRVRTG